MATIYLSGSIDRKALTNSWITCGLILLLISATTMILFARALVRGVWPPISGFEIISMFTGLLIALSALWITRNSNMGLRGLRHGLIILSLLDVAIHLLDAPTY